MDGRRDGLRRVVPAPFSCVCSARPVPGARHTVCAVTLESCPTHKWNYLVPPEPLVWFELEVALAVSAPETCSVTWVPGCDCFVPRCAFKWLTKRFQNMGRTKLVSVL